MICFFIGTKLRNVNWPYREYRFYWYKIYGYNIKVADGLPQHIR